MMRLGPSIGRDWPGVGSEMLALYPTKKTAEAAALVVSGGAEAIIAATIGSEFDVLPRGKLAGLLVAALAVSVRDPCLFEAAAIRWRSDLGRMAKDLSRSEIRPSVLRSIAPAERRDRLRLALALLAAWELGRDEPDCSGDREGHSR